MSIGSCFLFKVLNTNTFVWNKSLWSERMGVKYVLECDFLYVKYLKLRNKENNNFVVSFIWWAYTGFIFFPRKPLAFKHPWHKEALCLYMVAWPRWICESALVVAVVLAIIWLRQHWGTDTTHCSKTAAKVTQCYKLAIFSCDKTCTPSYEWCVWHAARSVYSCFLPDDIWNGLHQPPWPWSLMSDMEQKMNE